MGSFTGTELHSVDDKGRLMIPAKFRRWFESNDPMILCLMKMPDSSILVYQELEWEKVEGEYSGLSDFKQDERKLKMLFYSSSERVELDKQGRIMIPKNFLDSCGIKREVKIIGAGNKIAIWSPEKHEAFMSKALEDYETLVNRGLK